MSFKSQVPPVKDLPPVDPVEPELLLEVVQQLHLVGAVLEDVAGEHVLPLPGELQHGAQQPLGLGVGPGSPDDDQDGQTITRDRSLAVSSPLLLVVEENPGLLQLLALGLRHGGAAGAVTLMVFASFKIIIIYQHLCSP